MVAGVKRVAHSVRWVLAASALWMGACGATPTPTPPLTQSLVITTTDVAQPLAEDLVAAYQATHSSVTITIHREPLSALDMAGGDFALTVQTPVTGFATPVGYAQFAIVVNPANPIEALSLAQVQALFTGKLIDWGDVGGGGLVQPVVREDDSDAALAFNALALNQQLPSLNALLTPTWAAMRDSVQADPGAIGYLPTTQLTSAVKAIQVDARLQMLIVARAASKPSGLAHEFLAWVQSPEGQAVVAQRHQQLP